MRSAEAQCHASILCWVWNGIGELEMSWYVDARLTMLVSVSDSSSPSILEQIPKFLACSLDKCQ